MQARPVTPPKGYSFVQLMKEVEQVTKEPKRPKREEPPVPQGAKEFSKDDVGADQFGELLAQLQPPKQKEDPKSAIAKSARKGIEEAKAKREKAVSAKQVPKVVKREKLPKKVVVAPKTVDDLIRDRGQSESDDDGPRPFESVAPVISNPFADGIPQPEAPAPAKPDFDAFEARVREFEAKKQAKIEKLKEQSAPTFRPAVNKKSEVLDRKKRGEGTSRHEQLYDQQVVAKLQDLTLKKPEPKDDELEECTFRPQINKYDRLPVDVKVPLPDRHKQWEQNRQERIRELQQFQAMKEVTECTFKPETNKSEAPAISRLYYNS